MAEISAFSQLCSMLKMQLGDEVARLAIDCIIKTCGGDRVYIPQHQKPNVMPGESAQDIQRRLKVARSTSYYLQKKHRI